MMAYNNFDPYQQMYECCGPPFPHMELPPPPRPCDLFEGESMDPFRIWFDNPDEYCQRVPISNKDDDVTIGDGMIHLGGDEFELNTYVVFALSTIVAFIAFGACATAALLYYFRQKRRERKSDKTSDSPNCSMLTQPTLSTRRCPSYEYPSMWLRNPRYKHCIDNNADIMKQHWVTQYGSTNSSTKMGTNSTVISAWTPRHVKASPNCNGNYCPQRTPNSATVYQLSTNGCDETSHPCSTADAMTSSKTFPNSSLAEVTDNVEIRTAPKQKSDYLGKIRQSLSRLYLGKSSEQQSNSDQNKLSYEGSSDYEVPASLCSTTKRCVGAQPPYKIGQPPHGQCYRSPKVNFSSKQVLAPAYEEISSSEVCSNQNLPNCRAALGHAALNADYSMICSCTYDNCLHAPRDVMCRRVCSNCHRCDWRGESVHQHCQLTMGQGCQSCETTFHAQQRCNYDNSTHNCSHLPHLTYGAIRNCDSSQTCADIKAKACAMNQSISLAPCEANFFHNDTLRDQCKLTRPTNLCKEFRQTESSSSKNSSPGRRSPAGKFRQPADGRHFQQRNGKQKRYFKPTGASMDSGYGSSKPTLLADNAKVMLAEPSITVVREAQRSRTAMFTPMGSGSEVWVRVDRKGQPIPTSCLNSEQLFSRPANRKRAVGRSSFCDNSRSPKQRPMVSRVGSERLIRSANWSKPKSNDEQRSGIFSPASKCDVFV